MYCPSCGEEVTRSGEFCMTCGTELSRDTDTKVRESGGVDADTQADYSQLTPNAQSRQHSVDSGEEHSSRTDQQDVTTANAGRLDRTTAGAIAYLFGFVSGILVYLLARDDEFVRFHAVQSIVVFGGLYILNMVLGFFQVAATTAPGSGRFLAIGVGFVSLLLGPLALVLWAVLIYNAYQGRRYRLPLVGPHVERFLD